MRKEYFSAVKKNENFFKHADKDPEGALEFNTATIPLMLAGACYMLPALRKKQHGHTILFMIWFTMAYPFLINSDGFKIPDDLVKSLDPTDFESFKAMLKEPFCEIIENCARNWKAPPIPESPYDLFYGNK